ncbi:MAG: BMP family lipoprotein [Anaerolineales bacterium]
MWQMAGGKWQRAANAILAYILVACTTPTPIVTPTEPLLPTAVVPSAGTALSSTEVAPTVTPQITTSTRIIELALPQPELWDLGNVVSSTAEVFGWSVQPRQTNAIESIKTIAETGIEVLVINGEVPGTALCDIARQFPDSYFVGFYNTACVNSSILSLGNEQDREDQAGFIAGMVAGYATDTEHIAVFASTLTYEALKYRNGFLAGVRYTCPKCRVEIIDLPNPGDIEFASAEALKLVALGVDMVFATAGSAGNAALQSSAQTGAWVIGSQSDVSKTAFGSDSVSGDDRVLTSVYTDIREALQTALMDFGNGNPRFGAEPLSLANGGVVMAPFGANTDAVLSPLDRQEIEAAIQKLADGSLETGIDPVTGEEK